MIATCPQCGASLNRVKQDTAMLNEEQFDAIKAGDWYCDTCPGNGRGKSSLCYWWDREVVGYPPEVSPEKIDPPHYDGDACMRKIAELTATLPGAEGFCIGQAVKYLWRAGRKHGESIGDDMNKAAWYLTWLVEHGTVGYVGGYLIERLRKMLGFTAPELFRECLMDLRAPKSEIRQEKPR
jgi:hypothetical protein